jgi:hypothetical protein
MLGNEIKDELGVDLQHKAPTSARLILRDRAKLAAI